VGSRRFDMPRSLRPAGPVLPGDAQSSHHRLGADRNRRPDP
jgi:hypothetical protein